MRVLAVNAGSAGLKLSLLNDDVVEESAELPADQHGFDVHELGALLKTWPTPDAIGHRIAHGGAYYSTPVRVDAAVRDVLYELSDLAPPHQALALAALDAVAALLPEVGAVACFDTAFHAGIPAAAATYAVPSDWRERYAVRRYGCHGLSHAYAAAHAAHLLDRPLHGMRIVTCHLGADASLAAVLDGRSVDTTTGFTPQEGLVTATRSGTVDPGLVLWMHEHGGLSVREITATLRERSGLTALTGTGDMRAVEAAAARDDRAARLALDVYTHRLVGGIAAMAAATGGIDALVFTGGVGEKSPTVRQRAAERLGFLGVFVERRRNATTRGDGDISTAEAAVRTLVVTAREDLRISQETRKLLERRSGRNGRAPV
ncbi:acetate/propionate family kinase [Streptodolium elevatio]|uniref:Acetate kinase n=1 Tax=Streptodolium elevatio TaxID=3157996 RepID=A0ABV3DUR8_9ACTN